MVFDLSQEPPQLVYLLPIRAMYLLPYRGLSTMRACCVECHHKGINLHIPGNEDVRW